MQLSSGAIRAMGFDHDGRSVSAVFYSTHVYEVRGFNLPEGEVLMLSGDLNGASYLVGVGTGLNAVSSRLLDDDYVTDETDWAKNKNASPPYLMVRIGPTRTHTTSDPWIQEREDKRTGSTS